MPDRLAQHGISSHEECIKIYAGIGQNEQTTGHIYTFYMSQNMWYKNKLQLPQQAGKVYSCSLQQNDNTSASIIFDSSEQLKKTYLFDDKNICQCGESFPYAEYTLWFLPSLRGESVFMYHQNQGQYSMYFYDLRGMNWRHV